MYNVDKEKNNISQIFHFLEIVAIFDPPKQVLQDLLNPFVSYYLFAASTRQSSSLITGFEYILEDAHLWFSYRCPNR